MNDTIEFGSFNEEQVSSLIEQLDLVAAQTGRELKFEHISIWLMMCKPAVA
jgi:hypothetical protein